MAIGMVDRWVDTHILHSDPAMGEEERRALLEIAKDTVGETYLEDDPSALEWFAGLIPSKADAAQYIHNLFPAASWGPRYNLHWLLGDAIAGKLYQSVYTTF